MEDLELAQTDLEDLLQHFNHAFADWENSYHARANFKFDYNVETGRKSIGIADIEKVQDTPPTIEELTSAETIVSEALKDTEEDLRYPELAPISNQMQSDLRLSIKNAVSRLLMESLGKNDVLLLSALGIDGKQKILDVFIEECNHLKGELTHGSRNGTR